MLIRKAKKEDLIELVMMGKSFHQEAEWQDVIEWDDAEAASSLKVMIDSKEAIILVADDEGVLKGMIAVILTPIWFNSKVKSAQEWFWYVKSEYRGAIGIKLFNKMQDMLRQKKVNVLTMLSVKKMPNLEALYLRLGFRPSENTWIKRIL